MQHRYNFFDQLPKDLLQKVRERMVPKTLVAGESVYLKNDEPEAFYQVVSGKIRLSNVSRDGREILYLVFEDGDCFGEVGLLDHSKRPHNAIASGATELSVLSKLDFDDISKEHPEIIKLLAILLCTKLHTTWNLFDSRNLLPLPQRLATRIVDLATLDNNDTEGEPSLDINLSQIDLAHMMGASRQAVGKILKNWEGQYFIRIHYGKVTVLNLGAIQGVSGQQ